MSIAVEVLRDTRTTDDVPDDEMLAHWINTAVGSRVRHGELCVRIVDEAESARLNERYRGKSGATNVLSFPAEALPAPLPPALGDLALCAPLVAREALEQGKSLMGHWAHLCVHGALHLLGYDHETDDGSMMRLHHKLARRLMRPTVAR